MAGVKITSKPLKSTLTGTDEFPINDAGLNKKANTDGIVAYTKTQLSATITDPMIAGSGITTRSKLPAAVGYIDEAHIWSELQTMYASKFLIVDPTDTTLLLSTRGTWGKRGHISKTGLDLRSNGWDLFLVE